MNAIALELARPVSRQEEEGLHKSCNSVELDHA